MSLPRPSEWTHCYDRPLKTFLALYAADRLTPTVEAWLFRDGEAEPTQRVLEP